MVNPEKVETTVTTKIDALSDDQMLQIKGGEDSIIIDDIEI